MAQTERPHDRARGKRPALRAGALLVAAGAVLSGCSMWKDDPLGVPSSPRVVEYGEPVPRGGGVYKVGTPYQVAGQWFHPREDPDYRNVGIASWYGLDFHGRRTANGEIYDMDALSAAHPTLPMPTYARVRNLENGREVVVRINDRGPFAHGREIDLSKRAAELLDFKHKGTARVEVSYLGRAPLDGDDGWATSVQMAKADRPAPAPVPQSRPVRVASNAPVPVLAMQDSRAAAPPAPMMGGQSYVQVGSFRDAANASRLRYALASAGPVEIVPVDVGGITYFRVRVGPFGDAAAAAGALARARDAGAEGARLVTVQ